MNKSILILLLAAFFVACGEKSEKKSDNNQSKVQYLTTVDASITNVYYFHGKQRCKTCIAVGDLAKKKMKRLS